jgi:mRNA-degrading endonuclease RelE of RelBE toxin-antitoxin system
VTFEVFLSEAAQHDLDALPSKIAKQVVADCQRLARDPVPDGKRIKKLRGHKENIYRLRAGDYRVAFQRAGTRINIVRVLNKKDFERAY